MNLFKKRMECLCTRRVRRHGCFEEEQLEEQEGSCRSFPRGLILTKPSHFHDLAKILWAALIFSGAGPVGSRLRILTPTCHSLLLIINSDPPKSAWLGSSGNRKWTQRSLQQLDYHRISPGNKLFVENVSKVFDLSEFRQGHRFPPVMTIITILRHLLSYFHVHFNWQFLKDNLYLVLPPHWTVSQRFLSLNNLFHFQFRYLSNALVWYLPSLVGLYEVLSNSEDCKTVLERKMINYILGLSLTLNNNKSSIVLKIHLSNVSSIID